VDASEREPGIAELQAELQAELREVELRKRALASLSAFLKARTKTGTAQTGSKTTAGGGKNSGQQGGVASATGLGRGSFKGSAGGGKTGSPLRKAATMTARGDNGKGGSLQTTGKRSLLAAGAQSGPRLSLGENVQRPGLGRRAAPVQEMGPGVKKAVISGVGLKPGMGGPLLTQKRIVQKPQTCPVENPAVGSKSGPIVQKRPLVQRKAPPVKQLDASGDQSELRTVEHRGPVPKVVVVSGVRMGKQGAPVRRVVASGGRTVVSVNVPGQVNEQPGREQRPLLQPGAPIRKQPGANAQGTVAAATWLISPTSKNVVRESEQMAVQRKVEQTPLQLPVAPGRNQPEQKVQGKAPFPNQLTSPTSTNLLRTPGSIQISIGQSPPQMPGAPGGKQPKQRSEAPPARWISPTSKTAMRTAGQASVQTTVKQNPLQLPGAPGKDQPARTGQGIAPFSARLASPGSDPAAKTPNGGPIHKKPLSPVSGSGVQAAKLVQASTGRGLKLTPPNGVMPRGPQQLASPTNRIPPGVVAKLRWVRPQAEGKSADVQKRPVTVTGASPEPGSSSRPAPNAVTQTPSNPLPSQPLPEIAPPRTPASSRPAMQGQVTRSSSGIPGQSPGLSRPGSNKWQRGAIAPQTPLRRVPGLTPRSKNLQWVRKVTQPSALGPSTAVPTAKLLVPQTNSAAKVTKVAARSPGTGSVLQKKGGIPAGSGGLQAKLVSTALKGGPPSGATLVDKKIILVEARGARESETAKEEPASKVVV
jgi:hypothetical protein